MTLSRVSRLDDEIDCRHHQRLAGCLDQLPGWRRAGLFSESKHEIADLDAMRAAISAGGGAGSGPVDAGAVETFQVSRWQAVPSKSMRAWGD